MNPADHNPDTNPNWRPLVATRVYACKQCGTEKTVNTNHTGTVWSERCAGSCRSILSPHTASERVLPYYGPHLYIRELN